MSKSRDSKKGLMEQMTIRGRARYAEEEAIEKLLIDLSAALGWSASRAFCCLKKVLGELVFEIDITRGARNRDYELIEVQCECNLWHRKFGRSLSPNSIVGNIPLEPEAGRWIPITQTGQLADAEEALLKLIREKVLPIYEDFAADPKQAVKHLADGGMLRDYDIHLVLIELYAGKDYALEVAQTYYDDLTNADKKRIQRHQGGETQIQEPGNLLYIADQMYVRSGLLSWKEEANERPLPAEEAEESRPVQGKAYYTSREEQRYMKEIRRRLDLRTNTLALAYGFKSAGGVLQHKEKTNIFTLDITYAEKGRTLTASLSGHPAALDEVFWGMFDLREIANRPEGCYVLTETKQLRDFSLEDAKTEITDPENVENALRALLYWARSRVKFFEEQIDSVASFRELIAGDASQRVNRMLCDVYAMHYRDAMMAAQDMLRHHISGGVALKISETEQKDILEYAEAYCRKKLYG